MQDEVNTKVVAIMIKGGKISAEVLKKALDKFMQEIEIAQKQMHQQSHPHLPAHGVGAVAEEVRKLKCLLDLFEEHLDVPASPVKADDFLLTEAHIRADDGNPILPILTITHANNSRLSCFLTALRILR